MKLSPIKAMMSFGNKGMLSPHYVSSYLILRIVGNVIFEFDLPSSFGSVYPIFNVLIFVIWLGVLSFIVHIKYVGILYFLSNEVVPMEILDR